MSFSFKKYLYLALLIGTSPIISVEQNKSCVIDLYQAVKNHNGLLSYINWYSSAEMGAVVRGVAEGESEAGIYWQAIKYAQDLGDVATVSALKKSFERQQWQLSTLGMSWLGIATVAGCIYKKFSSERVVYNKQKQAFEKEEAEAKQELRNAFVRLIETRKHLQLDERQGRARGFVLEVLKNIERGYSGHNKMEFEILKDVGRLGPEIPLVLDEMQEIASEQWWNDHLRPAEVGIKFPITGAQQKSNEEKAEAFNCLAHAWTELCTEKPEYREFGPLPANPTRAQVELVYRKLGLKYHPDRPGGEDPVIQQRFREITQARDTLINGL